MALLKLLCAHTRTHTPTDRPVHCILVDSSVRAVRAKYKGLSASSLQKCHYFYLSTPKCSPPPPTLSTAIPTTVQALTTAYMKRYTKSFDVTEPCPKSWYVDDCPLDVSSSIVKVPKEHVHLFDGDDTDCSDTDLPTGTSPGPPLNISPLQLHILKRGPEF